MKKENFFLVTSAIKSLFPEKKAKILLLGEWCKCNLGNDFLNSYKVKVLSHHWEDENKKIKDYNYIVSVYRKICVDLSQLLNEIHGTNFSQKYWEFLLFNWLMDFMVAIYDRFYLINHIKKYNIIGTKSIDIHHDDLIPKNSRQFSELSQTDLWNNYVFSVLIEKLMPNLKVTKVQRKLEKTNLKKVRFSIDREFSFKRNIMKFISYITSLIKSEEKIFIINSYLKFYQEILLQLKINKILKVNCEFDYKEKIKINKKLRSIKFSKKNDDLYTVIIKEFIVKLIPIYYLEGYKVIDSFAKKLPWPQNPKIMFTSNNHLGGDVFKIWAAQKIENNIPLIAGQHGGAYFIPKISTRSDIEIENVDHFLSWGNKIYKNSKIIPLFNIKSSQNILKKKHTPGYINFIQDFPYRYQIVLISNMITISGLKKIVKFQYELIEKLNEANLKKVKIRLGSVRASTDDYEKNIWYNKNYNLKLESRLTTPIKKSISNSSIIICVSLTSTVFLECISSNIPVFIFSSYNENSISEECLSDIRSLKETGIIQNNSYEFSQFINRHSENIDDWWNSKDVQFCVDNFRKKYCSIENKPIIKLSKVLKQNFKPETHNI